MRAATPAEAGQDQLRLRAALLLAAGAALIRHGAWAWLVAYGAGVAVFAVTGRAPLARLMRAVGVEVALLTIVVLPLGWERAGFVLARALTSLLAVNAAVLSMGADAAVAALAHLPVPGPLRDTLVLAVRYGQALGDELARTRQAAAARGLLGAGSWARRATAAMAGAILVRALDRAERVHAAMLARGYRQSLAPPPPVGPRQRRWMAGLAAAVAAMVGGSYLWP